MHNITMLNRKYDISPELEQAAVNLLNSINKSIEHNGPGGSARENCINWREQALVALEKSGWNNFFSTVESCHLPSSLTPHHWIELTSNSPDATKYVWDGTNQFMRISTIKNIQSAAQEWSGYSDAAVERIIVLPESYE